MSRRSRKTRRPQPKPKKQQWRRKDEIVHNDEDRNGYSSKQANHSRGSYQKKQHLNGYGMNQKGVTNRNPTPQWSKKQELKTVSETKTKKANLPKTKAYINVKNHKTQWRTKNPAKKTQIVEIPLKSELINHQNHVNTARNAQIVVNHKPSHQNHKNHQQNHQQIHQISSRNGTKHRPLSRNINFFGPQPHGLSKKRLNDLSKYEFWATEKSDGVRFACYITQGVVYFIDRKGEIHSVTKPFYSKRHHLPTETVLDGEVIVASNTNYKCDQYVVSGYHRKCNLFHYVLHKQCLERINQAIFNYYHEDRKQLIFKVFDCLMYAKRNVSNLDSSHRFNAITQFMQYYHQEALSPHNAHVDTTYRGFAWGAISRKCNAKQCEFVYENLTRFLQKATKEQHNKNEDDDDKEENEQKFVSNTGDINCIDTVSMLQLMHKRLELKFVQKWQYKSNKNEMKMLLSAIEKGIDGMYYFTDPITGMKNANDGIIFTPENISYFMKNKEENESLKIRKWKPSECQSIDVKIRIRNDPRNSDDYSKAFTDHFGGIKLYVNDYSKKPYQEALFSVINLRRQSSVFSQAQRQRLHQLYCTHHLASKGLNYLIVECVYDVHEQCWKIIKLRDDKLRPNALKTCKNTFNMICEDTRSVDIISACKEQPQIPRIPQIVEEKAPMHLTNGHSNHEEKHLMNGHGNNDNEQMHLINAYNERAINQTMVDREASISKHVRNMNSWCKYVCITTAIRRSFQVNDGRKIHILDLGCGKGGDLRKYRGNKQFIQSYVGIDIAHSCIEKAKQEYSRMRKSAFSSMLRSERQRNKFNENNPYGQTANEFFNCPMFYADFLTFDMCSPFLPSHDFIRHRRPFNLINCQFALHYAFKCKETLNSLLDTIEYASTSRTHFVCSFVRDDVIVQRLEDNQDSTDHLSNIVFENKLQSITMRKTNFEKMQNLYREWVQKANGLVMEDYEKLIGIPYHYYQVDSVYNVEEYVVSFAVLCNMLWTKCKMKLIYIKTCETIKIESSNVFPFNNGYQKRELPEKWSIDEQQVLDTYAYALFQRI